MALRFALHPLATSVDVLAILDRIVRRVVRRLAADARDDDDADAPLDVIAEHDRDALERTRALPQVKLDWGRRLVTHRPSSARDGVRALGRAVSAGLHFAAALHENRYRRRPSSFRPRDPKRLLSVLDALPTDPQRGRDRRREWPGRRAGPPAAIPMVFQGKTASQICVQMEDPAQDSGNNLRQVPEHVEKDELVLWGWLAPQLTSSTFSGPGQPRGAVTVTVA
jgi:hypothetical protein